MCFDYYFHPDSLMKNYHIIIAAILALSATLGVSAKKHYTNPVISESCPDPTVIQAENRAYYLYATENTRNVPIYRSSDLINWNFVATAFNEDSRPQWNPKGNIWAPDINYIAGKYVLYYSKSVWGGEWDCGIGVASAESPEGPFTDHGALFISKEIDVQNSIDPFFIEDNGRNYLFWGSFHGIYGIELSVDGLNVKEGAEKVRIADNFMEGTYIHKRNGLYYLFGSTGSCCDGERSTYRVTIGRSENLFGPYVDKQGCRLLDGNFDVILSRSQKVIGPGHNAEIVTDDKGCEWMLYHGFSAEAPEKGRLVYLDRVYWIDGWPIIGDGQPSERAKAPTIKKKKNQR